MQFILHITDHFKISIPRINVAWHPRIRYSRAESDTNNAMFVRVIDSEQLWERISLLLPEIRQSWAVSTHSQNQNIFTITDISKTHRWIITCLLPLCRHCPSSDSSCPSDGQECPRDQCDPRSDLGNGDHSPGSCNPSPPSPFSPRQSSPRWAPRTSSSRALRIRGEMGLSSNPQHEPNTSGCFRHRLLSTFYQNVKMVPRCIISFPFFWKCYLKLCWPISPKLPWMLLNPLLISITESGGRISPRCLLIIRVSLFVTKPLRQGSQLSNRYLGSLESKLRCPSVVFSESISKPLNAGT